MAEQLRHIERMACRPHIKIQIVPFDLGAHVALNGNQLVMEFHRQRTVVHLEHRRVGAFLDDSAETSPFVESVASLTKAALSPSESAKLIATYAKKMEERHVADH